VKTAPRRVPVVTPVVTAVNEITAGPGLSFQYTTYATQPPALPTYRGRTMMLIDKRVLSQAGGIGGVLPSSPAPHWSAHPPVGLMAGRPDLLYPPGSGSTSRP
jgi:hypothetical protein